MKHLHAASGCPDDAATVNAAAADTAADAATAVADAAGATTGSNNCCHVLINTE